MNNFFPGQRWLSSTESELGLGTVMSTDHRTVTIHFPATDETRVYARQTAPLTRIAFEAGDTIKIQGGINIKIIASIEQDNLFYYRGTDESGEEGIISESQLDHFMQLNRPSERLFGGQVDSGKWFELRYQTLLHINRLAHSELRGLTGGRTSLIPHQLYIAHEVANRYAPRVLLADEVGLGKTIEAGMILHQQVITGRAQRILIVVPETLVHQWLVEMMRRFNLFFSIFNEGRCNDIDETGNFDNPFQSEQLVLCSLEFLTQHAERFEQSLSGEWDLLVVDEAHHLQWTPAQASPEYKIIEALAANTNGVLLLTATPEQLGKESHFARLRLLDPDRFHNFESYLKEETSYEPYAHAIDELMGSGELSESSHQLIASTLQEGDNQSLLDNMQNTEFSEKQKQDARDELIEHLLDRHGTGRILYRNTRNSVKGFPQRQLISYPLSFPDAYARNIVTDIDKKQAITQQLLCPELLYQERLYHELQNQPGQTQEQEPTEKRWTDFDPRIHWLSSKLKELKPEKVLVITASALTALDIAEILRVKEGMHVAVFHEGLSIVERDRAAAFFADKEYGSQAMICSEIGSEGRNFQFAHHLVLFDLPLNPDLLEQRIGRLDRIGQLRDIQIHVPYFENSAQEVMFRWYHESLSAFEHTCPAGLSVFRQVEPSLTEALHLRYSSTSSLDELINTSKQIYDDMISKLQQGRDKLLEYNSCRPAIANAMKAQAEKDDVDNQLDNYLGNVFDCYGIDSEEHSQHCLIIKPGDHMQTDSFPGLLPDGMTITYDRETALTFEDAHFITWEHPLVTGAMDLISTNETGNTAVTAMQSDLIKRGTLLLEAIFLIEPASNIALQSSRYFPPTIIRIVVDKNGKDYSRSLTHASINKSAITVDTETATSVIRDQLNDLKDMVKNCEKLTLSPTIEILREAHQRGQHLLNSEIARLRALSKVNPNVRQEEIDYYENHWDSLKTVIDSATPRLDALRVIVCV